MTRPIIPILVITTGCMLLSVAMLTAPGCEPKPHLTGAIRPPAIVTVERTVFEPPTPVPSATDIATASRNQAADARNDAGRLYPRLAGLTPRNLPREQPSIVTAMASLIGKLESLVGATNQTVVRSTDNDVAVAVLAAQLDASRQIIIGREDALEASERRHASELARNAAAMERNQSILQKKIDKLADAEREADRRASRWLYIAVVGLGGLLTAAGGAMAWLMPGKRSAGLIVAGMGGVCVALGQAGLVYGQQIAMIGLGIGGVVMIAAVIAAVQLNRKAAFEIADGIQQAILAGKIKLEDIRWQMQQAQSPLSAAIVDSAIVDTRNFSKGTA